MINSLVTVGCSFTYGEELDDRSSAWPQQLANRLGISNLVNLGEPAASNDKILRKTIEHTINNKPDLVVIAWTNLGRSEFADEFGYYDVWPGYAGNLFTRDGFEWRKELVAYISNYHSAEAMHKKFIQQVLLLQAYLDTKSIKYIMLNTIQNEYYKKKYFDGIEEYSNEVNKERYIGYNESGMAEWTYGTRRGPRGHFLDKGHQIVASKIYEHIGNLGWIS